MNTKMTLDYFDGATGKRVPIQISKSRLLALAKKSDPHLFKPRRVRNIVKRALGKSKSKEFVQKLDAVLAGVAYVRDLEMQQTAINPRLTKHQRDGTIAKERNNALGNLIETWDELIAMV